MHFTKSPGANGRKTRGRCLWAWEYHTNLSTPECPLPAQRVGIFEEPVEVGLHVPRIPIECQFPLVVVVGVRGIVEDIHVTRGETHSDADALVVDPLWETVNLASENQEIVKRMKKKLGSQYHDSVS